MRSHRPFALVAAASVVGLALILDLTPAGAARAGDVTYPQLNSAATPVLDTDLLAIWRTPGPLAKLNASLFSQYVVNGLGKQTFLQTSNALSELSSVQATARSNLGLGTAATAATGTSGIVLCFLNTNCTVTGTWTFGTAASFPAGLSGNVTGNVTGSAGSATGNAGTASKWQAVRAETLSGDVSGTASVDGSTNWTVNTTLATVNGNPGLWGAAPFAPTITVNGKGLITAAASWQVYPAISASNSGAFLSNNGSQSTWSARASLYVTGCSAGGCAINGSNNVSAVTRYGTGLYYVTFASVFPSTNYTISCTPLNAQGASPPIICVDVSPSSSRGVNTVWVQFVTTSGTAVDPTYGFNFLAMSQ